MFLATIICSDADCDEVREIAVERLSELDGFSCECGYGFVLAAVAELREAGGEVVAIEARRAAPAARRRAA
jgi:hypothetical protein